MTRINELLDEMGAEFMPVISAYELLETIGDMIPKTLAAVFTQGIGTFVTDAEAQWEDAIKVATGKADIEGYKLAEATLLFLLGSVRAGYRSNDFINLPPAPFIREFT
jgi:hypothetical protein